MIGGTHLLLIEPPVSEYTARIHIFTVINKVYQHMHNNNCPYKLIFLHSLVPKELLYRASQID